MLGRREARGQLADIPAADRFVVETMFCMGVVAAVPHFDNMVR